MNTIISSHDGSVLDRLRRQNKSAVRKTDVGNPPPAAGAARKTLHEQNAVAGEPSGAGSRLALRMERTLQGFREVRALLEEPAAGREEKLETIIKQTRFQDEPVLSDYAKTLRFAVRDADAAAIDCLIRECQGRLHSTVREKIVRENLKAASSLVPGELFKEVVRALEKEGLPPVSITRQRALDLLRAL